MQDLGLENSNGSITYSGVGPAIILTYQNSNLMSNQADGDAQ